MKHYLLGLLATACFVVGTTAQITKAPDQQISGKIDSDEIPKDPNVKVGTLSNGLTYYIRNNGKPEDKVELRLVVNAGSILEDDDQLGLAHFMEHMNFNGTKNFKKNEIVDYLQSIGVEFGADLNAYTSFDETVYILPIPSNDPEKLEKGFQILEDWAFNTSLTEKDIDEERGVVLEEYRLGLGADERMRAGYLPKMMYGSKYADRLPIGTKESIENFTYESLRRFRDDWYRPDLMAVVAVGDLDVAELEKKIKSHFGKQPAAKNPRPREISKVPNHDETFVAVESDKEASFTRVQVLYKDGAEPKPLQTVGDYKKAMVKGLFAQMINNRLDELRNGNNPPFVFGFSFHGGTFSRTKEAYQSSAMTSETGQMDALRALLTENERVKRYGFQAGEFERAKKDIMARKERAFKDKDKRESNRIIGAYVNNYLEKSPMVSVEWDYEFYKNELKNVKIDQVNDLINSFLHKDNRVIILTGPEKEALKKVKEEEILSILGAIEASKDIAPYEDKSIRSALMTETPAKGSITKETINEALGYTELTLSNGAKVTYKVTDFKNDEILFDSFSFGGSSLYSDEDFKRTVFANGGLSQAGVDGLNLNDLNKVLTGKIVRVNPFIGALNEGFNGSTTPKDLETLFQLVHLYFTKLNKDDAAFKSYTDKQKGFLTNLLSNPQFYYQNEMGKFRNQGNPRYVGFPTAAAMDAADYDLAYKKYQERFADAGDFNFYFVGNIDPAKLKEYAATYLASLPGKNSNESYKVSSFRPLSGSHEKIVKKGKDPKSLVNLIWTGETSYDSKESYYLASLGEILSIKLIEKLREEESGVYGVGARGSMNKIPYGSFNFSISFPCGPENVDKLKAAAIAEVNKVIENGPTDKDLAKIKESQLLKRKENLKQNRFWLRNLRAKDYQKRNIEDNSSFEEKVKALSKDDIHKVAKKYLTKGYITGIHLPEDQ
ncbi:M16 family metallopeptidase [Spongiimicrobium salis]|uniref:M16 family metallopeptidase n=1 Tax=Spongiimicrobium salis TaxID=1667022 RepID=UPI00374D7AD0